MEDENNHTTDDDNDDAKEVKSSRGFSNWQMITFILIIFVAVMIPLSIFTKGFTGMATADSGVSENQVAEKIVNYINTMSGGDASASLVDTSESNGLYLVRVKIGSTTYNLYATKDGEMFFPTAFNLSQTINTNIQQQPTGEIPRQAKPSVELFVMSFCPYGVQAETAMKPVVDLLGDSADIKVRFIASVQGNTPSSIQSLHGSVEALEDLHQVCVQKYYNQSQLWNYVSEIDNTCYAIYRTANASVYDACWKAAAQKNGIDSAKIEQCTNNEGISLLKADESLTDSYGVSGSPTLIINGQIYEGGRTANAYKDAICSGFDTPPSECSENVESTASVPAGECV